MTDKKTGLELLREPFPANQISKLPKPTKAQTDEVRNDYKAGIRCEVCGGWHHPKVIHLDYVGHAALTDRLLDADSAWTWEPLSMDNGLPVMDQHGGMWIRLTVCGITRLGYGHAGDKSGGDAIKEVIGDALRNAAMRFGAALDLWHKGDLHGPDEGDEKPKTKATPTGGLWEAQSEESRAFLTDIAMETVALLSGNDAAGAVAFVKSKNLDADEQAALWTRFDSKQRAAMKAVPKE